MARCTSSAATDESTPPERPQMTLASPTCSRILRMDSSMMDSGVNVGAQPQASQRKLRRTSMP